MRAGAIAPMPALQAASIIRARTVNDRVWWVSFVSLTSYVLANRFGAAGMALCLGAWLLYIAAWPTRSFRWIGQTRLPYALPLFAILSTAWSIEPTLSLKLGIEFLLFTAIAVVAARAQSQRSFLSSFMCALLVGVVMSAALRTTAPVGTTGEIALIGVFGSKNNLANFVCLSMITSLPVLIDRQQSRTIRMLAAVGLLLDPAMLIKAHSLGALFAGGAALATSAAILFLSSMSPRPRRLILGLATISGLGFGFVMLIALAQGFDLSSILVAAGKDPSLTGRTFLWSRASEFIAIKPLLGLGYQAFWVQGHVEAEALWRYAQIETRAGFHFHNLYYETAVELGNLGVAILAVFLLGASGRALYAGLTRPGPVTAFLCALVVFFAMRVGVELDFLDPFSTGSFLLPTIWLYAAAAANERAVVDRIRRGFA
jgi:exopolysaccharide production protein ExoQ